MRLNRRNRPPSVAMDMTPMIDVTFQLIIFFMTVSQASVVENEMLELPQMSGAVDQTESTLTVNVTAEGRIVVVGRTYSMADLEELVGRTLAAKGGRPELVNVVIRVDRRGTCAPTNQVLTRLKKEGILRVRIAVEVPGPTGG